MNRNQRRRAKATVQKAAVQIHKGGKGMITHEAIMQVLVMRMAQQGPDILAQLRQAVGPDYKPGHVLDVLMKASAAAEQAILRNDADEFVRAAADVLFLARDVAVGQGVITAQFAPTEKPS